MLPAQDHKRLGDGDSGPNTGGMGAYAPVSVVDDALVATVRDAIVLPTLAAMAADNRPFRGLLFCGVMLTPDGPQVIEFNARFGDPETEAILPLLDTPLADVLLPIAQGGSIAGGTLAWHAGAAVTTVLAASGYPDAPRGGDVITIPTALAEDPDLRVYHAGTARNDAGELVTAGGRVLAVTATAPTFADAAARSRAAAESIHFEGRQYRRDIGWRELERVPGNGAAAEPL
jgi:phosphoribosylamine---glycine ligase